MYTMLSYMVWYQTSTLHQQTRSEVDGFCVLDCPLSWHFISSIQKKEIMNWEFPCHMCACNRRHQALFRKPVFYCTSLDLSASSLKKTRTGKIEMNYFWLITKSSLLSCEKNKTISRNWALESFERVRQTSSNEFFRRFNNHDFMRFWQCYWGWAMDWLCRPLILWFSRLHRHTAR